MQQLFPHMPALVVIEDLRITRSVEITIDNILDGRLVVPPIYREHERTVPTIASSLSIASTIGRTTPNLRQWDNLPELTER